MLILTASSAAFVAELPDAGETQVDTLHDVLSQQVTLTATWLDSFFGDRDYEAEANETSVRWALRSFSERGEGAEFSSRLRLRLRLPGLENRALFFIGRESDDLDTTDSLSEEVGDRFSGRNQRTTALGLRYFFTDNPQKNVSLNGGVRIRSRSPVGFIRPRLRHFQEFSAFDLRFIQELTWFTDTGLESQTELQLERPVWDRWFFRSSARLDWYEDEDGLFPTLGFNWRRPIDEQRVVSVSWNNYFRTEPDAELDSSVFGVRYRQRIWRRWLSFEVSPQIAFPEAEDYDATPGVLLKLEAEFRRER